MADQKVDQTEPAAGVEAPRTEAATGPVRKGPQRWRLPLVAVVLLLAGGTYGGYRYVWGLSHETTDDAQVEGHICAVASKVAGYVAEVLVEDNQLVAAGEVLFRIRPDDYEARVQLAEAQLAQAEAELEVAERVLVVLRGMTAAGIVEAQAAVRQEQAGIETARKEAESATAKLAAAAAAQQEAQAQVQAARADYDYADFNLQRISALRGDDQAAEDEAELARARYLSAEARLAAANEAVKLRAAQAAAAEHACDAAKAAIQEAQAASDVKQGNLEKALTGPDQVRIAEARVQLTEAGVRAARAHLELARLERGYCDVTAPAVGVVSKRSVEAGQYLQPGQPVLAVVPLADTWVLANFKETQLRDMRVGHPAQLEVDAYPDRAFRGRIDSIAAGTGARFSLLPPENATGNFVKVVQRIPVKIVLERGERDAEHPLRPGMNVVVTVDTSERSGTPDTAP